MSTFLRHRSKQNKPINLESWMRDLPDNLRAKNISKLVIPGSRHSMSFGITKHSPLAGDYMVMKLNRFCRTLARLFHNKILIGWSRVQSVDLMQQLCLGIRYFDMRLEYDQESELIWSVHLMKSTLLQVGLDQVNLFLQSRPKEIVILDFQHLIDFNENGHRKLMYLLQTSFGDKLCPSAFMSKLTLNKMFKRGYQVIVVCRNLGSQEFFKGCFFPIMYSKTDRPTDMINSIESRLCYPWPDKWLLIVHLTLKLESNHFYKLLFRDAHFYARVALNHSRSFLENLRTTMARPTVIVADFVHLRDAELPRMIVRLNYSEPPAPILPRTSENLLLRSVHSRSKLKMKKGLRERAASDGSVLTRGSF